MMGAIELGEGWAQAARRSKDLRRYAFYLYVAVEAVA